MQNTTNYNLLVPEGTDIVNPLTQMNPNWNSVDTILRNILNQTINIATESVSGTLHTITRSTTAGALNTTYRFFRYRAQANWAAGDSMKVDGANVTVILPDGSTPGDDAYITGVEVLCSFFYPGTVVMYLPGKYIPTASEVTTTGGGSVQDYIDNTSFKNLETWTPNIGEDWATFIARIRDNSTRTIPANLIRCNVDGNTNLIFRQTKRTGPTSWQYETDLASSNELVKYVMYVSSNSSALRKYDLMNGTITNLSAEDAETINIYGLDV